MYKRVQAYNEREGALEAGHRAEQLTVIISEDTHA